MATGRSPSAADRPKPNPYRKAIDKYYATLKEFEFQRTLHEGAVSSAFQNLLADTARPHGWTLIPQLGDKSAGKDIRPDGTLKDEMYLVRGHWEAKDTNDVILPIAKYSHRFSYQPSYGYHHVTH